MTENCHVCGRVLTKKGRKKCQKELLLQYMSEKQKSTYHPDSSSVCRSCAVAYEAWKRNRSSEHNRYREQDQEIASSSTSLSESSGTTPSVSSASLSESLPSSASSSGAGPSRKRRHRSEVDMRAEAAETIEEVDEESSFSLSAYERLIPRRSCLYGCAFYRVNELRLLTIDERFNILQESSIYTDDKTYVCKVHESEPEDNEHPCVPESYLTSQFTVTLMEEALNLSLKASAVRPFRDGIQVADDKCERWTALTYGQFTDLCSAVKVKSTRKQQLPIAVYLAKLRTGEATERLADFFCLSYTCTKKYLQQARAALLEQFVPINLGYSCINRETALQQITPIARALFLNNTQDNDRMIAIADGTYIYHQKSAHHSFQRSSYSPHKYRNLFKPMMIVAPNGYILDVKGPYSAKTNDATIFDDLLRAEDFNSFFERGDIFILDRGFRNCLSTLQNKGFRYRTPEFSSGGRPLTTEQANRSRMVTKVRWIVEDVNGKIKTKFRAFDHVWPNKALEHAYDDFRIACAIQNKYGERFHCDADAITLAEVMLCRNRTVNPLADMTTGFERWNSRSWITVDPQAVPDFPVYTMRDLLMITLGPYQLEQAEGYYQEHIAPDGRFRIQLQKDVLPIDPETVGMIAPKLIRARIQSRHSNATKYIVLVCYDTARSSNICGYCQCKNGARTVGCCAHVATIIWYLGWAQYQRELHVPSLPMEILETHNWTDDDDD